MEHREPVLGSAHTRFNDYVGTVAADDAEAVTGLPSLYELANIDRDLYTIVAIDLRVEGPVTATVYAVDRIAQGFGPHSDVAELGEGDGEIPVVPFELPEPNVEDFIRRAFQRISVRLVTQLFHDHVLAVTLPNSPEERGA
jgi:hypothetical protein